MGTNFDVWEQTLIFKSGISMTRIVVFIRLRIFLMKAYHPKLGRFKKIEFLIFTLMLLVTECEKYTELNFILTL